MSRIGTRIGPLLAAAAAFALLGSATAQAASVQASQTGGVSVGQSVSVAVSGLAPNLSQVAVGQCTASISGPNDCNLGGSLLGNADGSGYLRAGSITLVGSVGGVDCTASAGACTIAVTSLTDPYNILAAVPLSFG
ncbi:neocarzinostatin apoprotein domain-containing protein [Nocardia sp. alder85J]|uniref:neocarzinostatin apoprotein domain-containing protein n=1 Tax=Nocardia sp. alder85J TaxID=2862949 RepID=UPI001CD5D7A5|nr:neocarzinostatin apoprotein domain-containing protein [Nocardia sp. alder85J]MCX4096866.1 neocarzinostatin apoprotein domain-containing protein [Nocardia sp. alder85J]